VGRHARARFQDSRGGQCFFWDGDDGGKGETLWCLVDDGVHEVGVKCECPSVGAIESVRWLCTRKGAFLGLWLWRVVSKCCDMTSIFASM
jgi:hypothetical protein